MTITLSFLDEKTKSTLDAMAQRHVGDLGRLDKKRRDAMQVASQFGKGGGAQMLAQGAAGGPDGALAMLHQGMGNAAVSSLIQGTPLQALKGNVPGSVKGAVGIANRKAQADALHRGQSEQQQKKQAQRQQHAQQRNDKRQATAQQRQAALAMAAPSTAPQSRETQSRETQTRAAQRHTHIERRKEHTIPGAIGDAKNAAAAVFNQGAAKLGESVHERVGAPLRALGDSLNGRHSAARSRASHALERSQPARAMKGFGDRLRGLGNRANKTMDDAAQRARRDLQKKTLLGGFGARLRSWGDRKNADLAAARKRASRALQQPTRRMAGFGAALRSWGDKQNAKLDTHQAHANEALGKQGAGLGALGQRLRGLGDQANQKIGEAGERFEGAMAGPTAKMKGIGDGLRDVGDRLNNGDREVDVEVEDERQTPESQTPEVEAPQKSQVPESQTPEPQVPESQTPESQAPESQTPEVEAPESQTPEVEAPQKSQVPESQTPESQAPESQASSVEAQPQPETAQKAAPGADTGPELAHDQARDTVKKWEKMGHKAAQVQPTEAANAREKTAGEHQAAPAESAAAKAEQTETDVTVPEPGAVAESPAPTTEPVVDLDPAGATDSQLDEDTETEPPETVSKASDGSQSDGGETSFDPPTPAKTADVPASGGQQQQQMPTDGTPSTEPSAAELKAGPAQKQAPSGGAGIKADPAAAPRTASEMGKAVGGAKDAPPAKAAAQGPGVPPTQSAKLPGADVTVQKPEELPKQGDWAEKAKSGMTMPAKKVNLPEAHGNANRGPGGERSERDAKNADGSPKKSQAQIQAEAEQLGKHAKAKVGEKEKGLQGEAKAEADTKKAAAKAEADQKDRAEKQKGDAQVAAEEAKGEQKKQVAEAQGEQKKRQAEVQAKQKESQAAAQGTQKEARAKAQETAKRAAAKQKEQVEKAKAKTEAQKDEAKFKAEQARTHQELNAEHQRDQAAARQAGEAEKAAVRSAGEAEKRSIRQQGHAKAEAARQKGAAEAQRAIQRGQQQAQAKRSAGRRRKAQLEAQARRKKQSQSWYERAWNAVKSAVSSLMNRARQAWNAAKNAATALVNAARRVASQIKQRAAAVAKAAWKWADEKTGGVLTKVANKVRAVAAKIKGKLAAIGAKLKAKWNALKARIKKAIADRWNAFKAACSAIAARAMRVIAAAVAFTRKLVSEAKAWVKSKVAAARAWLVEKVNAAVSWVQTKYREIRAAVVAAVSAILSAVKAAVTAVWNVYANALKALGSWLKEAWDKFSKWAQEAFVKFWNGPWRDILIGVAVAVLIAAVTVATGGAGLVLIVAVSAGATGALRAGGEIAARRAAVAIKNDPERAERFQKEMAAEGGDAAKWYDGVKKDEGWGTTLKHGAVEGARGAVEGAVSGLVGGAGGALATKVAGGIAKAGAKEGAKLLARQGVQKAAEWGSRVAIDAGLSLAGDVVTGTVNAELDVAMGIRTREEAYQQHVTRNFTAAALGARVVGSGVTGTLRMGSHKGAETALQDRIVNKVVGSGASQATSTVRQQVTRQVVDMSISGVESGTGAGLQSMANGGEFIDGFGKGFVGGVAGHAGRLQGEKFGRRMSPAPDVSTNPKIKTTGQGDAELDAPTRTQTDTELETTVVRKPDQSPKSTTEVEPGGATTKKAKLTPEVLNQKQADRLQRLLPGSVPGLDASTRIVPDNTPGPIPVGTLTVTQARRYMRTVSAMRKTPSGREALARVESGQTKVTMETGKGSFAQGDRINIDPETRGRHNRAGVLAHEAHHKATQHEVPDPHAADRHAYVEGMLRNEAEAQAKLFEYHREAGSDPSRQFGAKAYHDAYEQTYQALKQAQPDMPDAVVRAQAQEAGTVALKAEFGNAVPSTSITTDANGAPVIREGAPQNYNEHYGKWHDENSVVGAKAQATRRKQAQNDASLGDTQPMRAVGGDTRPMKSVKVDGDAASQTRNAGSAPADLETRQKQKTQTADDALAPAPHTKKSAGDIIEDSEGRLHNPADPRSKGKGHAQAHIPQDGQDPIALATSRPAKANNTVYRNGRHAQQDLRNILKANSALIDAAPVGQVVRLGEQKTGKIRYGYNSKLGKTPADISFDSVTVSVVKHPDGSVHLVHFAPKYKAIAAAPSPVSSSRVKTRPAVDTPAPHQKGQVDVDEPQHRSRAPKLRASEPLHGDVEPLVGMPQRTPHTSELDVDAAKKPKVALTQDPDPVTVHGDKTHKPKYVRTGEELFKGDPTLKDVNQGYLGDCFLHAGMAAVAKQRPDLIKKMFVDHGDGTVTVTLHTLKNGYVVPAGTEGATKHPIRVTKDLPSVNGKTPTYGKGSEGQLWPGLLEKAYTVLKGDSTYQGINKGGRTTEAMETITGKKSSWYRSASKSDADLQLDLETKLKSGKPVCAGSNNKDAIKKDPALQKLATSKDVVANHAYVVDKVEGGLVFLKNPWGSRHPKPLTMGEFKKLYPNVYVGDVPNKAPQVQPKTEQGAGRIPQRRGKTGKPPVSDAPMERAPKQAAPLSAEELKARKVEDDPDPVTVHDGKEHRPTYQRAGKKVFKGDPKLGDVQQGYLADCYLVAAMGAVAKSRPDVIKNMFVDHNDGTVSVTFYTTKSGFVVPSGSKGATVHTYRVTKELPSTGKAGVFSDAKPTYAKGAQGQLWPGLLEKAYAIHKKSGKYQGLNTGGSTIEAIDAITGKSGQTIRSSGQSDEGLLNLLESGIASKKPLAAGSVGKDVVKRSEAIRKLAEEKQVFPWHAYVIDKVEDGKIYMFNPWGSRHPKPLTPAEFKQLYPNVFYGDAPKAMKTEPSSPAPTHGAVFGKKKNGNQQAEAEGGEGTTTKKPMDAADIQKRVVDRVKAGTGIDQKTMDAWVQEHGLAGAANKMGDELMRSSGLDPANALTQMKADPEGFYKEHGALVTGAVLRKGMKQAEVDAATKGMAKGKNANLVQFADSLGFTMINQYTTKERAGKILGSGEVMPGRDSGGLTWVNMTGSDKKPGMAGRMVMADYAGKSDQALLMGVPKSILIPPSHAIETKDLPEWLNKKAYYVKGKIQSGMGRAAGLPPAAVEGPIHLLPKGMRMTQAEVDDLATQIKGAMNTEEMQRKKVVVLTAGSGMAAVAYIIKWELEREREEEWKEERKRRQQRALLLQEQNQAGSQKPTGPS